MNDTPMSARDLGKTFPGGIEAVAGVDLDLQPGTVTALLGPTGCGKSTVLRMLGGLEVPTVGDVRIDPDIEVGFCFQDPRLLPWGLSQMVDDLQPKKSLVERQPDDDCLW